MNAPKGIVIRDSAGVDYSGVGQPLTHEQIAAACETIDIIYRQLCREYSQRGVTLGGACRRR